MKLIKKIILTLGHLFMFAWSSVAIYVFLLGYGSTGKAITVFVNPYGEAYFEFIMVLVVFPIMVYTMAAYVWDVIFRPLMKGRKMKVNG